MDNVTTGRRPFL